MPSATLLVFFLLLFVVAAVHAGAAFAASLGISGFVETKINYTPEDRFSGQTQVQFGVSTSSGKLSLSLAYYDATKKIWELHPKLDSGTYYPYSITLTASGPWWKKGPTATTKLGDFDMLGPSYIAGDTAWPPARQIRGVLVSDLSYQGVKLSGYFGWPKYSKSPSSSPPLPPVDAVRSTLVYGGAVNVANWRGAKADLFGAVRRGYLVAVTSMPTVSAPNGQTMQLTAINPTSMAANQLLLFTKDAPKRPNEVTNIWWTYVLLDEDMKVVEIRLAGVGPVPTGPTYSTPYAYVLAGHDSKATWLKQNLSVGSTVQLLDSAGNQVDPNTVVKPYSEAVLAVEAKYKLAGINLSGQWRRQVVVEPRPTSTNPNQNFTAGFQTLTASTDLDILDKVMATKPLSLSLAYRNIDKDFVPWAALKDPDSNSIYAQRDQRGFKLTASTTVFPDNPVDVSLELDAYVQKSDNSSHRSSKLTLGTKLAGFSLSGSIADDSTSISVSREIGPVAGVVDTLTPSLKIIQPTTGDRTTELGLSAKVNLGGFTGIEGSATYTVKGQATTTTASAKYVSPNGITVEAKVTDPNDAESRTDTYAQMSYKVTF